MSNANLVKTTILSALGIALAACSSSDERSLIELELQLAAGAVAPQTVHLSAANTGGEVKAADVPWTNPPSGMLQIGLFIPGGVVGPVTIAAKGVKDGQAVVEGAVADRIPLKVGGKVGPYRLVLATSVVPPINYDGGVDAEIIEAGVPDSGASEDGALDGGAPDERTSEAGTADGSHPLDTSNTDVPIGDVPVYPDATDSSLVPTDAPSDVPALSPDGSTMDVASVEAGHTPGWEPAQNIENDLLNPSFQPAVAVDPVNEHVYAAWTESTVKVRRWNRVSGTWEKTVVVENRGTPQQAAIGVDAKGNAILVWCHDPNSSDTSMAGTWASRTSDGVAWSPPVRIGSLPTWDVQLAVARNGTARAVYPKVIPGKYWPMYSAYFDGTSWTENPQAIDPSTSYADQNPRLVVNAAGDGILIFDRNTEKSEDNGIGAVTLTGQTFSVPTVLNPNHATTIVGDRAIAMNRKGEAVFVWSEGYGSSMGLYAKTYSPGAGWSSPSPTINTSSGMYDIAVALDEQGKVTIVWQQALASGMNLMGIHGSVTGSWSDIAILEYDNLASNRTDEYAFPKMAIDGKGNVLVVWRKDRSTDTTPTYGIYASRFSAGTWLPQFQLGQKTGLDGWNLTLSVSDEGLGATGFLYLSDTSTDPDTYNTMVAFYR